mgnify:CR=1 FL=1
MLEYRIQEMVGKSHKKTRVLGKDSTLSQNTPHRFNILDKGKSLIDEDEMQRRVCNLIISILFHITNFRFI